MHNKIIAIKKESYLNKKEKILIRQTIVKHILHNLKKLVNVSPEQYDKNVQDIRENSEIIDLLYNNKKGG